MFSAVNESPSLCCLSKPRKNKKPDFPHDERPIYAVIEVGVEGMDFRPKNPDSVPSDGLSGIPLNITCQTAVMINESEHAQRSQRWCCVALNGSMFYLSGVAAEDRPTDPTSFPPGAKVGLTYDEAKEIQNECNVERAKLAKVPRRWCVAIRPIGGYDARQAEIDDLKARLETAEAIVGSINHSADSSEIGGVE